MAHTNAEALVCPACNSIEIEDEDALGMRICTGCGKVVEEGVQKNLPTPSGDSGATFPGLQAANQFGGPAFKLSHGSDASLRFSNVTGNNDAVARKLITVSQQLKMSKDVVEQVLLAMEHLAQAQGGRHHRPLNLLLGGCIYKVCRRNQQSLSMAEIADCLDVSEHDLGRTYKFVAHAAIEDDEPMPEMDAEALVARGMAAIPQLDVLARSERMQVMKNAQLLIRFALSYAILAGRKPMPVVAAAVHLALFISSIQPSFSQVCNGMHCAVDTAERRLMEMTTALVTLARQELPWVGDDLQCKPVALKQHMPFLFQYLSASLPATIHKNVPNCEERESSQTSGYQCMPPAFLKAVQEKDERRATVHQAELRMTSTQQAWRQVTTQVPDSNVPRTHDTVRDDLSDAGVDTCNIPQHHVKRQRDQLLAETMLIHGVPKARIEESRKPIRYLQAEMDEETSCTEVLDPDAEIRDEEIEQYIR
mmetsp:Transcript_10769/g.20454  ORF Transcript_10769/g.20454 Transcript_10769/m.20454 type:complete len:478 (-) Transcript_10769:187-1620(-)|eukprot:CAMPEP_0114287330 /NCGR_PEP_ID=MMETSP0059-20121206/6220_1 /TAXON_ID=36894 /ORGANISM="Pyramimonas parkeae, Strain CCMP726" /LENGTH=477 /DNA_ID=CAMNT_0001408403 /DNA_START=182 /DNA_END=1615 /DNA_ORIENTATION=+